MDCLTDFFSKLQIEDSYLAKYFKEVFIKKIVYYKEEKRIYLYLVSKKIVQNDKISLLEKSLLDALPYFNSVKVKIHYTGYDRASNSDIIKKYWNNILNILISICPPLNGWKKEIEYMCVEDNLKIKIPKPFFYDRLIAKDAINSIKNILNEELGLDLNITLEKAIDSKVDTEKIMKKSENLLLEKIKKLDMEQENLKESSVEEGCAVLNESTDDKLIYGDNVRVPVESIKNLNKKSATVGIIGEVFNIDIKELRNGKILMIMAITDHSSSISAKIFLNDMNKDSVMSKIKVGTQLKIKGDIIYDDYQREISLMISGIRLEEIEKVIDDAKVKRVELHAHTQMSSMDAICSAKDLVKQAINWGHKAIAITDHGVVQAFPDAMNAAKGNDIKILYGVEGYLVEDDFKIIKNPNDKSLSQTFVVFDIETTGFSSKNDKITEIGAVKIKDFEIVDSFSQIIDPQKDIPYRIQELTGITNDLVKGKPTIEEVLPRFLEFVNDSILVAHNADFDMGFITEKTRQLNELISIEFKNDYIDTLMLSRILLPQLKKFKLDNVAKALGVSLLNHHRAVDDAKATAEIFIKFLHMLNEKGANTLSDVNSVLGKIDYTKLRTNHISILVKNQVGLKNLYKIISDSHINHFYRQPRILRSVLNEHKEGLLIGSACASGSFYEAVRKNIPDKKLENLIQQFDYIEVMPLENNIFLIENGEVEDIEELKDINRKIIELAKKCDKIPVATGDVHFLNEYEGVYRNVLKHFQGYKIDVDENNLYFRTTNQMLEEFSYLGEELAYEVVVKNTNKIADMIDDILPVPNETYPPVIEGSDVELRTMCYDKAKRIYGEPLPDIVVKRLDRELNSIIGNGYAVMYIIAQKLVAKSLSDGYLVGSRGSVGSSFAATMSDITEVNPLPAHYICENEDCKYSYFYEVGEWGSGIDLPDKNCPKCGRKLKKDGHDIPFEVFLGFEGDKEPDIDLNFSGNYQPTIHKYTEELFGEGYVYRAGTIGTVADKTAFGYAKKYVEENDIHVPNAEVLRLAKGCTGVKRTSGQHPGGVMVVPDYKDVFDFTPIQYPANDKSSGVITTHFDYHSISGRILKLDILGHDGPTLLRMIEDITGINVTKIPLDDQKTMSLFTSLDAIGVTEEQIGCPIGCLAIPEFGTKFVRQMLLDTKPTTFAELVRISGLSHGTDVWVNNAQDLVRENVVGLKDVISTRDDIMNYLIFKGLPPKMSFTIMENVRKGKGLKPEFIEEMKKNDVPEWYIDSCKKIKYMFPKAHAVAYVMTSFRLAYCKVYYPEAFYATYFTTKVEDFDSDLIVNGLDEINKKMDEISALGNDATVKEKGMYTVLEVAREMYARDIKILPVDIYHSDAREFQVVGEKTLLPPLMSLQGVGENAALNIQKARENGEFISKEDLRKRTKVTKTVIEVLSNHGCLNKLSDKDQLSFI